MNFKFKVFGLLLAGCFLCVCPSAKAQAVFSGDLIGSSTSDAAVGGIGTAPAPWVVTSGSVTIQANGKWKSVIKGLVVPTLGTAQVTGIAEALVCGGTIVANTPGVTLDSNGNAKIKATVTGIPSRCAAPAVIIYVTEFQGMSFTLPGTQFIGLSGFTTSAGAEEHSPLEHMGKQ